MLAKEVAGNYASASEAAAESLRQQAHELVESVETFKL